MAKPRDTRTGDLLKWEPTSVEVGYSAEISGRGPIDNQIARMLSRALRDVKEDKGFSRATIAGLMTLDLGRNITEDQLDKWSSEASTAHRIPLDAFVALVKVTEVEDLLGFIPQLLGYAVIPQRYAEIVDLHLIEEKERELAAHKAALQARLRNSR